MYCTVQYSRCSDASALRWVEDPKRSSRHLHNLPSVLGGASHEVQRLAGMNVFFSLLLQLVPFQVVWTRGGKLLQVNS